MLSSGSFLPSSLEHEKFLKSFQRLGPDAGDVEEILLFLEGACADDAVGGFFADAGQSHEFAAGGGVRIDGFAGEFFGIIDADAVARLFLPLILALRRKLFPVRFRPNPEFVGGRL